MIQMMRVANNDVDSAQSVMGDEELAKYLVFERPESGYYHDAEDETGHLIKQSTIDEATSYDPDLHDDKSPEYMRSKHAAEISSWLIDEAGNGKLPDAFDDESAESSPPTSPMLTQRRRPGIKTSVRRSMKAGTTHLGSRTVVCRTSASTSTRQT